MLPLRFSIWMQFRLMSVWSICARSSLWDTLCTVHMIVGMFMVHAATLLIFDEAYLLYVGGILCVHEYIQSISVCLSPSVWSLILLTISARMQRKNAMQQSRWKTERRRASRKQKLSKSYFNKRATDLSVFLYHQLISASQSHIGESRHPSFPE